VSRRRARKNVFEVHDAIVACQRQLKIFFSQNIQRTADVIVSHRAPYHFRFGETLEEMKTKKASHTQPVTPSKRDYSSTFISEQIREGSRGWSQFSACVDGFFASSDNSVSPPMRSAMFTICDVPECSKCRAMSKCLLPINMLFGLRVSGELFGDIMKKKVSKLSGEEMKFVA
jgi:hypothetical protein